MIVLFVSLIYLLT